MLDLKFIRENPDLIKENIKNKFQDEKLELVDEVIELDVRNRELMQESQSLRAERNKLSQEINQLVKEGKDITEIKEKVKNIPLRIKDIEDEQALIKEKIDSILIKIPNVMSYRVPIGKSDEENVVDEVLGELRNFDFDVKGHVEVIEELDLGDFESSSRVSGNGFYYLQGDLALLNQALIRFAIEKMVEKGFLYVETPLMLNNEIINRVTDLHDQENMVFRVKDTEKSLIGTSEHSLIGRFVDQKIDENKLPIKHTSYSMCFRKEIGSHGIDEKGVFRTHQFNKVEMIVICKPEESDNFFEEMKQITIDIFRGLDLPIRILKICSGDLGDLKKEQIDVEVYSPRKKDYFEVGSCSNLTTCQANKLGISTKIKGEKVIPHTLNNTAIATSRALVAILENNQNKDGSINIPEVLVPYMFGKTKLEAKK